MIILNEALARLDKNLEAIKECRKGMEANDVGDCLDLLELFNALSRNSHLVRQELDSHINHLQTLNRLGGRS